MNEYIIMEKLNFDVFVEQDEDGMYVASVPELDGCFTQGKSMEEVMERIRESIELCLEDDVFEEIVPMKFIGLQRVEIDRSSILHA
ncbi:MAG: putative RNase H-like HicB family nuclease [Patescibacteria group bacterium]|jgi:predicted RNase H-like HicB family nuclease